MAGNEPKSRINALTSLRFFAALWVVFFHQWLTYYPQTLGSWAYWTLFSKGFLGVDLFFLLSGYILAYVYLKKTANNSPPRRQDAKKTLSVKTNKNKNPIFNRNLKDVQPPKVDKAFFWRARFARIYPVYALSFFIEAPFIAIYVLAQQDPARQAFKAIGTLLAHLALLQAWVPAWRWCWNFPSWTLSTEAFFYLLFPFLGVWFWKKTEGKNWLAPFILLYLLTIAPSVLYSATGLNGVITDWNLPTLIVRFFPPFRIPEFLLGMLLLRIQEQIKPKWGKGPWLAPLLFLGGGAGLILALEGTSSWKALLWHGGLFDPFFMMILLGAALSTGILGFCLSWKPLVLLGDASYSIYILQIPIAQWWQTYGPKSFQGEPIGFWTYLILLILASLGMYRFFETPLRVWIRAKGAMGTREKPH